MSEIVMNDVEKQVFNLIAQKPVSRNVLIHLLTLPTEGVKVCSRATLDRILTKLIKTWGLVKKNGKYSLTPKGQEYRKSVEVKPGLHFVHSGLKKVIDKLPTEAHRGLIYFILAAIVAKRYLFDDFDDFWPGFIIGGDPGQIKSLLARIVCETLGLDPTKHIQNAIPKTPAQVLGPAYQLPKSIPPEWRIDPAEYWNFPFVCWDEIDKVTNKETWRYLFLYLDGHSIINQRKTDIEARATCLVCMNFETSKLEIPTYYLRRAFVVDSKALYCDPETNEAIGADITSIPIPRLKIDGLGVGKRKLDKADIDFLRKELYDRLRSTKNGEAVDTNFLQRIVLGMSILQQSTDIRDLCYWAVTTALCFLESQGRTKEGWRDELIPEWENYRLGRPPGDYEIPLPPLEPPRPPEPERPPKEILDRVILIKYLPKLRRLKAIKESFKEMSGDKHDPILSFLAMDIRKFDSKLPTEKRESKVTESVLKELELILDEWEGQHRPIREAWEAEQKRLEEEKEKEKRWCRCFSEWKGVLVTPFGKGARDSRGVLWSKRAKPIREDIGKVLNPETRKEYFKYPFLKSINDRIEALRDEHNQQLGGIKTPEPTPPGGTEEEKAEIIEEAIEGYGEPTKGPTITVPYWQSLLLKLGVMKLKKVDRGKGSEGKGFEGRDIDEL